jgi:DNA-binding transcriptional MerR regulator
MADMLGTQELLSIGRFARVSGLTVKALRHYDDIGLLQPARVDDSTGYRYYTLAQARDAEAIRRLRRLDVPLEDVADLLHADAGTVRERLAVHRARLEGRAVETQRVLASLTDSSTERRSSCPKQRVQSSNWRLRRSLRGGWPSSAIASRRTR